MAALAPGGFLMGALTIGPFSFPGGMLVAFAAILAVSAVGNWMARARGVSGEWMLWTVIGAGLLAARAAFVARHAALYAAAPLGMLDIRDGGFTLAAGVLGGAAAAAWLAWRHRAQRLPVLAGAGAGGAVLALAALASIAWPQSEVRLPPISLARLEGGTAALGQLAGKPVVVNMWASWCPPCRREMPVLRQAQRDHPEITFLFVNQGETPDQVRQYLDSGRLGLANVLLDPGQAVSAALGSKALPTTFFFDARGVLVERRLGELSAATLAERLEGLRTARQEPVR